MKYVWGSPLRFPISNKLPGDADAAGLQTVICIVSIRRSLLILAADRNRPASVGICFVWEYCFALFTVFQSAKLRDNEMK